jgi:hypothetical protein
MKIRWSSFFFGYFAPHFQIKLSTHGSNLNPIFCKNECTNLYLLMWVLIQNFNTMDLDSLVLIVGIVHQGTLFLDFPILAPLHNFLAFFSKNGI